MAGGFTPTFWREILLPSSGSKTEGTEQVAAKQLKMGGKWVRLTVKVLAIISASLSTVASDGTTTVFS